MSDSQLVLVLLLIGRESGASVLKPITKRSNAKPMQTRITFDTQVKTALIVEVIGSKNSRHLLDQSKVKTKLIVTHSHAFPALHADALADLDTPWIWTPPTPAAITILCDGLE